MALERLSEVRAEYLASAGYGSLVDIEAAFRGRDAAARAGHSQLVLWFEHDLHDQLQLLQLLDLFGDRLEAMELIQSDRYLGPMTPHELAELFPSRQPLTVAQVAT